MNNSNLKFKFVYVLPMSMWSGGETVPKPRNGLMPGMTSVVDSLIESRFQLSEIIQSMFLLIKKKGHRSIRYRE